MEVLGISRPTLTRLEQKNILTGIPRWCCKGSPPKQYLATQVLNYLKQRQSKAILAS
jgi:hypothetical protein